MNPRLACVVLWALVFAGPAGCGGGDGATGGGGPTGTGSAISTGGGSTITATGGHGGAAGRGGATPHGGAGGAGTGGASADAGAEAGAGGLGGAGTGGSGGGAADGGADLDAGAEAGGDDGGGVIVYPPTCSVCHGSPENPAPPHDLDGNVDPSAVGVGAHQSHLTPAAWHGPVGCSDCHVVPSSVPDPGVPTHLDGMTQLTWSALAKSGSFDANAATCAGTYCHGASLPPDAKGKPTVRAPTWTTVDGSQKACGSACHSLPPGGKHPPSDSCPTCHGDVIATFTNGPKPSATWKAPKLHVDGQVEVAALTCASCHGDPLAGTPAPPSGTHGETQTTDPAVGAHDVHLAKTSWHRSGQCVDCHEEPQSKSHSNGVVDLSWGAVTIADGANPAFDAKAHSCANVYCHGATLRGPAPGGVVSRVPVWTTVDGTFDACGKTCHTNPPGGGHPQNLACPTCHVDVIASYAPGNPPTAVFAAPERHGDGKVDVIPLVCTSCHGDAPSQDPAPPLGTRGETSPADPAVGAHQAHLADSTWHRTGQCADCHSVPKALVHSSGMVEIEWNAPSANDGVLPAYSSLALTCTNTYCHGTTLAGPNPGGVVSRTPVWNVVDGSFDACGSTCHTNPPGAPHTDSTACPLCHTAVIASFSPGKPPAVVWKDRTLHIDGKVDAVGLTCTTCHGDPVTKNAAPPKGTNGEVDTSARAVGAHAAHLTGATWHRAGQCTDCHQVPASAIHSDGVAKLTFAGPAGADGATPTFSSPALTCSNYCHGATLFGPNKNGSVAKTPVWTTVNGAFSACGSSCHTNPPGPPHVANTACPSCHAPTISAYSALPKPTAVWKDASLHVDGKVDVSGLKCTSCHGDPQSGSPAPPHGTAGETLTTEPAVGAHTAHLGPSAWHRTGQCVDCHKVPAAIPHNDGVVDFTWGTPSTTGGVTPAFDAATVSCKSVYCHGVTLPGPNPGGVVARTPVWTKVDGSFDACGASCHTNPPAAPHPQSTACASCHDATLSAYVPGSPPKPTWKDPTLHIDGKVQVSQLTCTSCHGDPVTKSSAPPLGTHGETKTSDHAVGAHQQHLGASAWHRAGECVDCHLVPQSNLHSNGVMEVSWGAITAADGALPSWAAATYTCSGVYCHGSTLRPAKLGGALLRQPIWTTVNGSYGACGASCHTNPPGSDHPTHPDCTICHASVVKSYDPGTYATVWTDAAKHVDGLTEVTAYHDLPGWTTPKAGQNHHGRVYFLQNQQKDEHGVVCATCHGADFLGGSVGVSCDTAGCHSGGSFKQCTFCHGSAPAQVSPPVGVNGEQATGTLSVGRHVAHVTPSATHLAFTCATCHTVPAAGDLSHTLGYVPSADLSTTGHHGDVAFSGGAAGTVWTVAATLGNPVTARGTCTKACHSNGAGGNPVVTPYWAGGAWVAGGCGNCHAASPNTGSHSKHVGQAACSDCHPGAGTATHLDGLRTVLQKAGGGVVTTVPPGGACGNRYTCTGACHGTGHGPRCW